MASTGTLTDGLTRLGLAYVGSAADLWTRAWEVSARHARQAVVGSREGRGGPALGEENLPRALRRYLIELATVPALALERLIDGLDPVRVGPAGPARRIGGQSIPIPARVLDATQGMAIYAVPRDVAQAVLAAQKAPFVPVDLGRNVTGLAITGVRYRASDLGVYDEVGVGFLVAPARDPHAVGLYFFALPVTGRLSRLAGTTIWGYAKTEERIDVTLGDTRATWALRRRRGRTHVLTISFPRGGHGSSTGVTLPTYTLRNGHGARALFVRTGRGERTLAGSGAVALSLGDGARTRDLLVAVLHRLGLPSAPVILHSWTETMSGELGPPQLLSPREPARAARARVRGSRRRRPRRS
jgi:hypothetical protein